MPPRLTENANLQTGTPATANCTYAKPTVLIEDRAGYDVKGLVGQHGLSILVETRDGKDRTYRILFDTGQNGGMLLHNCKLLGVDLTRIDFLAFSHRHYDHTGGTLTVLQYAKGKLSSHTQT